MAYYRAGRIVNNSNFNSNFWNTVNGNFLDVCVLEWLKLFGEKKGNQSWENVITENDVFKKDLLKTLNITEDEFSLYINQMRKYRDKFIAHLDSDKVADIPNLQIALESAIHFYNYLLANEEENDCFIDAPIEASIYYSSMQLEAQIVYSD
jgi:hypothetical protein